MKVQEFKIVDHPHGDGPAVSIDATFYGCMRKIRDLVYVVYEQLLVVDRDTHRDGDIFYDVTLYFHAPYYPGIESETYRAPNYMVGPFLQYLYGVQDKYPTLRVFRKIQEGNKTTYLDYI